MEDDNLKSSILIRYPKLATHKFVREASKEFNRDIYIRFLEYKCTECGYIFFVDGYIVYDYRGKRAGCEKTYSLYSCEEVIVKNIIE